MSHLDTLNSQLQDSNFVANLKVKDPEAFQNSSYAISGGDLRDDIECNSKDCKIGIKVGKGEPGEHKDENGNVRLAPITFTWLFCYTCNGISHARCQGVRSNEFVGKSREFPWRCLSCEANPANECAKVLFRSKDLIDASIRQRRNFFLKSMDLSQTANDDSDIELDVLREQYDKQRKEFEKLAARCRIVEKAKIEADNKIAEMQLQLNEFAQLRSEFKIMQIKLNEMAIKNQNVSAMNEPSCSNAVSSRNTNSVDTNRRTVVAPALTVDGLLDSEYLINSSTLNHGFSERKSKDNAAPVPLSRKSVLDDIDLSELTRSERITLEQAKAQIEATEAQREIASSQCLDVIRRALPKITKFSGDPKNWIRFKQDIERYRKVGKYSDYAMKLHILQALEGLALERVQNFIDNESFEYTLKVLEKNFGEPSRIIDKCGKDILSLKLSDELYKDDVLVINSKIQAYFSACKYANVECANSNQLAMHVFNQLGLYHKSMYRHKFRLQYPNATTRLVDLHSLFEFLEELVDDLEDKHIDHANPEKGETFAAQVNAMSMSASGNISSHAVSNEDAMYEMIDKNESPYGYDFVALKYLEKFCHCCHKGGHFVVQCREFKAMDSAEKWKMINSLSLCRNCLLTSGHRAIECNLKGGCGHQLAHDRCSRKHHVVLHKSYQDYYGNQNGSDKSSTNGDKSNSNKSKHAQNKIANLRQTSESDNSDKASESGNNCESEPHEKENAVEVNRNIVLLFRLLLDSIQKNKVNLPVSYTSKVTLDSGNCYDASFKRKDSSLRNSLLKLPEWIVVFLDSLLRLNDEKYVVDELRIDRIVEKLTAVK